MSEIRQRKKQSESSTTVDSVAASVTAMAPAGVKPYIALGVPYVKVLAEFIEASIPFLNSLRVQALALWTILSPYKPELLLPACCGLILVFFGGEFLTLIAAVEAYKMCSHETMVKCVQDLTTDFTTFYEANKKDDALDADGNGIADATEASAQVLATRKTLLFLKTVEPKRVTDALAGINAGMLAIVATLKLEFAKSITLGNSIALIVEPTAVAYVVPGLKVALTKDYEKWAEPLVTYTIKSIAVSVAWLVQRVVSAFHSAIRGAHMFTTNVLEYLTSQGYMSNEQQSVLLLKTFGAPALAAIGLWFQFRSGFTLPFPLNVLLFPFTLIEWFLLWAVNSS